MVFAPQSVAFVEGEFFAWAALRAVDETATWSTILQSLTKDKVAYFVDLHERVLASSSKIIARAGVQTVREPDPWMRMFVDA